MPFIKKIFLLSLGLSLHILLTCAPHNSLITALLGNKTSLAKQILKSNTPPTQEEKDEALVYASGCLNIITKSYNEQGIQQAEMVAILLKYGANSNYINRAVCNMTPLQLASAKGRLETVRILLQHDADIHMINSENCNALSRALEAKKSSIVNELLRRGAVEAKRQQSNSQEKLTNEQLKPAYHRLHAFHDPMLIKNGLPTDLVRLVLTFDGTDSLLPAYSQLSDATKENW